MSAPRCPECNSMMVLRTNRQTNEQFYGCSAYPECTETRPVGVEDDDAPELPSDRYRRADRQRWRE